MALAVMSENLSSRDTIGKLGKNLNVLLYAVICESVSHNLPSIVLKLAQLVFRVGGRGSIPGRARVLK
jgi:hypothetical protein